jgi:hypothetical protein
MHDGTIEGHRCRTFDYSVKNLITITGEEKIKRGNKKGENIGNRRTMGGKATTLTWTNL